MKSYVLDRMEELLRRLNSGLIYSLMTAEIDGQRLTDEEVIASTIVTIIGGHETTTNLIASGFLALLRNRESLEQLRNHPEIVVSAVEELLRYESPVQHTARIAPANMELGGKSIQKGAKVVAVLAAANRDPNRFPIRTVWICFGQTTVILHLAGDTFLFWRTFGTYGKSNRDQRAAAPSFTARFA